MNTMTAPHAADSTFSTWLQDDYHLAPPNLARRQPIVLDPRDVRRIELNAALTAAGIAPSPGDREAIERLSALPQGVHEALHRWLTH